MTVEIPAGAIVAIIVVAILFLAYRFRAKILPPHTVTPPAPGPAPAPTPAPTPAPDVPAPPAVDPNNLADVYVNRDALMKRIGTEWPYVVVIDGKTEHGGFGPGDVFTTQPDGSLAKVKP